MNTLNTALELPVEEYDCLDEEAIEIISIWHQGEYGLSNVPIKDISKIQYDSLIDQINADLESQKQEALDFQAGCISDDSKHNPNW